MFLTASNLQKNLCLEIFSYAKVSIRNVYMLPVVDVLEDLKAALKAAPVTLLTADTGSGKTTWLPLQLLAEEFLRGKKILLLEPRRVAARAAARRLADNLQEKVGFRVGYSVRFESQVSNETKLEVVTEGILTRRLARDPELEDTGLIIFDEFHERHVETDIALALALQTISVFREDLKLLIMSATIDTERIQKFLKTFFIESHPSLEIRVLESKGTSYPVSITYSPIDATESSSRGLALACARKSLEAHKKHGGDILIFLPGVFEIFTAIEFLESFNLSDTQILPLSGELASTEQDRALADPKRDERRIIVSTPIAESSLTISGLTVVVDSGLVRQSEFNVNTGTSYLRTTIITQDAATQRAGRAGRLGPGYCYRMYSEADLRRRPKTRTPEILHTDLADVMLRSLIYGSTLKDLPLLDRPTNAMLDVAEALLKNLDCLDAAGKLTPLGSKAAQLPLNARLAVMVAALSSKESVLLAALLSERIESADLETYFQSVSEFVETGYLHQPANRRVYETIRRTIKSLPQFVSKQTPLAQALLYAFPDRVAMRRSSPKGDTAFILRNGKGVSTDAAIFSDTEFLIAVDLSGSEANSKLRVGLSLPRTILEKHFETKIVERKEIRSEGNTPRAYKVRVLDSLILEEKEIPLDENQTQALLIEAIVASDFEKLLGNKALQFCTRSEILRGMGEDIPKSNVDFLKASVGTWLSPFLHGCRTLNDLTEIIFMQALQARLTFEEQRRVDELLPPQFKAPSGAVHPISYSIENQFHTLDGSVNARAQVSLRIQEVFGLKQQPQLLRGKLALFFELLSPRSQPLAVTKDLPAFWKTTYSEVRKEMRGRYPKHFWPEDPLSMEGTTGTKKAFDRKAKKA